MYHRRIIGVLEERHSRDIPRFSETLVSDIVHCFKSLGRVFGFLNIAVRMCRNVCMVHYYAQGNLCVPVVRTRDI